jgi:hypothetical protein
MPVLSKAQLFGSLSRPALDEIKKELSPEVKDLLRDELKIQQGFIEGLGRTIDNTPNNFKQQLRRKLDDDSLMVTPSRRGKGANYPDTDRPKVLDKNSVMVALNSHLDMFIDIKTEFDRIPTLVMAQFLEGQLEDSDSIREYVSDDVADLIIDRPRMVDYIRTAIDTLREVIKRLKGQKTPKKESPEFIKSLTKLLENYAKSPIQEFWMNEFNELNKITDLRNQKNVNKFLKAYENSGRNEDENRRGGRLSQKVLEKHPNLNYHLVDKPYAKEYFDKHNFKGTFFVKDLSNAFDTDGLLDKYDLVITNDFLEHVLNPSIIVQTIHKLTTPESYYFISNPNWRMCHQWIYRGLFDFDNFLYFLYTHNFRLAGFFGSPLKAAPYPKIDSEKMLPDSNLTDWNHYLIFTHRNEIIKNYVIPSS